MSRIEAPNGLPTLAANTAENAELVLWPNGRTVEASLITTDPDGNVDELGYMLIDERTHESAKEWFLNEDFENNPKLGYLIGKRLLDILVAMDTQNPSLTKPLY